MPSEPSNRCCPTDTPAAQCVYHPTGNDFYMAGPVDSKMGIIIVGDIFGMMPNSKRLADIFGEEGYLAIMPDFFGEKAWKSDFWPADYESAKWNEFITWARDFELHKPRMNKAIEVLRKMGCTKIGAIGMCWGAKLAFQVGADGSVDAVATAHPSFFFEDSVTAAKTPVLVMPSFDDPPLEEVKAAVEAHPVGPNIFQRFSTIPHGYFGARFDPDTYTAEQMEEVNEARRVALDFFKQTLQ